MQEVKVLKIRVGGSLALLLERAVAAEGVTAAEILRRGLLVYCQGIAVVATAAECKEGPWEGPPGGIFCPPAAPPSSPPPSSPPAPPLTPPSVSPPALLAPTPRQAEPAEPADAESGLLFPDLTDPCNPGGPDSPEPPPGPPPLLLFPCLADRRTGEAAQWALTAPLVAQWEETFPGMDVLGEARKAREWLLANHRKTCGGMRNFLLRWFCKAQDSGRFMRRTAGSSGSRPGSGQEPRTLDEVYGFASWAEWEATLEKHFEGRELAQELGKLGEIRARWEAKHG